jgi:hypothetical protein
MTAQTDLIVGGGSMNQGLMRIVTGDTVELPVRTTPAAALLKTKRLKSNRRNTAHIHLKHVLRGAMARSTEIYRGCCVQTLWIQDYFFTSFDLSRLHSLHVPGSRTMTGFAGNAFKTLVRVKAIGRR